MAAYIAHVLLFFFVGKAFLNPLAIPAIYLFLSNFFVYYYQNDSFTSSKVFALTLFVWISVLIKQLGLRKSYHKLYKPILCFVIPLVAVGLYHYFQWGVLPQRWLVTSLKGSWFFLFFLFPKETYKKCSTPYTFSFFYFASLLLIAPFSISEFGKGILGIGRSLSSFWGNWSLIGLLGDTWPIMDDNVSENISLFTSGMIYWVMLWVEQVRKVKTSLLFLIPLLFSLYVLYVNQYFISFVVMFINIFVVILYFLVKLKNIKVPLILVFFVSVVIALNYSSLRESFSSRFSFVGYENTPHRNYSMVQNQNRVTVFFITFKEFLKRNPLRGDGEIGKFGQHKIETGQIIHSEHSTFLDSLISFGLLFGVLAHFYYLLPLGLIIYFLVFKKVSFGATEDIFWINIFLTVFILSIETIFGRESLQVGALLALCSIFYLRYSSLLSSNEQRSLQKVKKSIP